MRIHGMPTLLGLTGYRCFPTQYGAKNLRLVQLVFERGAKSGATLALHNAVSRGNYEIVEWLLDNAGPDVKAKNFQGKTALTVSSERSNDRIVALLKRHGAMD